MFVGSTGGDGARHAPEALLADQTLDASLGHLDLPPTGDEFDHSPVHATAAHVDIVWVLERYEAESQVGAALQPPTPACRHIHTFVCATHASIVEVPHELLWRTTGTEILDHDGSGSARVRGIVALVLLDGAKVQCNHRLHGTNCGLKLRDSTFVLIIIVVVQTDLVVNPVGRFSNADAISIAGWLAEGGCPGSRACATDASTSAFFADAPGAADEETAGQLIAMRRLAS